MPNIALKPKTKLASFRKIAIGTWATTYDPSVYGTLTIRMDETMKYMERFREATGRRLTLNHLMARAVGAVLKEMPDANAILRFNRIYVREDIKVFFQVALEDPETGELDLSGLAIAAPQEKTLVQIIDDFENRVSNVRKGKDKELEKTRGTFKKIPFMMLNVLLKAISFFSYTLNLDLRWAGIPKDPFGSVMVTNIGSLGLDLAYPPLVPYSRVPLLIAMGSVSEEPVVQNGQVVVGKVMRLCATFDHRILDGSHAAIMSKTLKRMLESPFDNFDRI